MASQLKMAMVNSILTLKRLGWSQRRIAEELGIDRGTVAHYVHSPPRQNQPLTRSPVRKRLDLWPPDQHVNRG